MKAYKLLRVRKDGTLGSLFINRGVRLPIGVWIPCGFHPTKGYALRPGWHSVVKPYAPHLSLNGRAWFLVEIDGDITEWRRPLKQGGTWFTSEFLRIIKRSK